MFYNFGMIHKTLGVTSAMETAISDYVWTSVEIANVLISRYLLVFANYILTYNPIKVYI